MIALDKKLHFAAGVIIAASVGVVAQSMLVGVGAAVVAGAAKEGYDWLSNRRRAKLGLPPNHDVDLMDFAYTAVGGAFVGVSVFFSQLFGGL